MLPFTVRPITVLLLPTGAVVVVTAVTFVLWPYIQPSASPLFFVAVMMSAVYGGLAAGLIATVLSTGATAFFFMGPQHSFDIGSDDVFRLSVFAVVALLTNSIAAQRKHAENTQHRLIAELREAHARVRTLSEQLPICPYCKRVRSTETTWLPLDRYLDESPDLRLSHALCPDCSAREHPEFHATHDPASQDTT